MPNYPSMIDREDFLDLFHQMMQPHSSIRVIRLLGEGKMGKSHLMTKVLPAIIADHYDVYQCLIIDMRQETSSVPDYLHQISSLLSSSLPSSFPAFNTAYQEWLNRPKINISGMSALLAKISVTAREGEDDAKRFWPKLTTAFANDLQRHTEKNIIFLFDTVNDSRETVQDWLMDMLLVHLARMEHVRVIVAGRHLPDANGSYARQCEHFELRPVKDEQPYIDYCRTHAPQLKESEISMLARVFEYHPGQFAEALPRALAGGGSHA